MTTIAARQTGDGIQFAWDQQTTLGGRKEHTTHPKVFANGKIVFAVAGHVRYSNILAAMSMPKRQRKHQPDTFKWVSVVLTNAIRQATKDADFASFEDQRISNDSVALVAVDNQLFEIGSDYSVTQTENGLYSIGSGSSYALGALMAGASPGEAVEIARHYDIYTGGNVSLARCEEILHGRV